jgi:hypothetical protein
LDHAAQRWPYEIELNFALARRHGDDQLKRDGPAARRSSGASMKKYARADPVFATRLRNEIGSHRT